MKKQILLQSILIAVLSLSVSSALAQGHGNGNGNSHGNKHSDGNDQGNGNHGNGKGKHGRYFRDSDYGILRQNYSGPTNLPPGLRKKYYRTGTLPPGWQKRFQPMPVAVVQQLPPIPAYCQRGYIDGYAVVYDRRTRIILDTVDLVGAIAGH